MKGQITIVRCTHCQSIIMRPFGRTVCSSCEARDTRFDCPHGKGNWWECDPCRQAAEDLDDLGNPGVDNLEDPNPADVLRDLETSVLRRLNPDRFYASRRRHADEPETWSKPWTVRDRKTGAWYGTYATKADAEANIPMS